MGTPAFAVPSLAALAASDGVEVVMVASQPDRPQGRGRRLAPSAVRAWALEAGLPTCTPTRLKDPGLHDQWLGLALDLVVVAAYGRILPPAVLALPRLCCVNVHASLLPALRGAAPIAHALLQGHPETGISIMRMEAGLDTGPVWRRASLPIPSGISCGELTTILAELGAQSLLASLDEVAKGRAPEPQDDQAATWAPMLTKADGLLDWRQPAQALARQVQAYNPWPGAHTSLGDSRLTVWEAHAEQASPQARPGCVTHVGARGVAVATGAGALWLRRVQAAGKPAMDAPAWARGRQVAVGHQVGRIPAS